jgi:malonyl CoA-acyl carrier protein transacylase
MKQHISAAIEIGPGKVLTGLAKRDMEGITLYNIDALADADELTAAITRQGDEK